MLHRNTGTGVHRHCVRASRLHKASRSMLTLHVNVCAMIGDARPCFATLTDLFTSSMPPPPRVIRAANSRPDRAALALARCRLASRGGGLGTADYRRRSPFN